MNKMDYGDKLRLSAEKKKLHKEYTEYENMILKLDNDKNIKNERLRVLALLIDEAKDIDDPNERNLAKKHYLGDYEKEHSELSAKISGIDKEIEMIKPKRDAALALWNKIDSTK